MAEIGRMLFFRGLEPQTGEEPWVSDGKTARQLQDLAPGQGSSNPTNFVGFDDRVFMSALDTNGDRELYWYNIQDIRDGLPVSATHVPGTGNSLGSRVDHLCVYAGLGPEAIYMGADGPDEVGNELYRYNGTGGLELVYDLRPSPF